MPDNSKMLVLILLALSGISLYGANPTQSAPNNKFITPVSEFNFREKGKVDLIDTFSITAPGSYYLTQDIGFAGRSSLTTAGGACAIYVNSNDVVIDLGNYTLYNNSGASATSAQKGIDVAAGKYNVVIRNGNITGFQDTGIYLRSNCDDVRLQNLTITQCAKQGVYLNGTADTNASSQNMITNCLIENSMIGRTTGTDSDPAYGIILDNCFNILVNECAFNRSDVGSNNQPAYGALISSCTNVTFSNCEASSNRGATNCYGFHIHNQSHACSFLNCKANGNWGTSATGIGFGFSAQYVYGCLWENCTANGNEGSTVGYGFSCLGVKYNKFAKCASYYNKGNSRANASGEGARSFHSQDGEGNVWECSEAVGSKISSDTVTGAQCIGFNLINETNSIIKGCTTRNHNDNSYAAWGIGINLQNTTRCTIDNCSITHNKSATANHGIGLKDTKSGASTTLVTRNFFFNNGTGTTTQNIHLSYATGDVNLTTTVNQGGMSSLTGINPYQNVSMTTL